MVEMGRGLHDGTRLAGRVERHRGETKETLAYTTI